MPGAGKNMFPVPEKARRRLKAPVQGRKQGFRTCEISGMALLTTVFNFPRRTGMARHRHIVGD
jgi:hypothetical protein